MTDRQAGGDLAYVHGTHAEEQARLGIMNQILNGAELAVLKPRPGERWLELGAGTAIFARVCLPETPSGTLEPRIGGF